MSTALIIFAKAPVAGQAKTRLIPALGPDGAAHLAERLLMHTLRHALSTPFEHLELCVSPDEFHPAFARARQMGQARLQITQQGEGDLGVRMHRALRRALSLHARALLIGTDAPSLDTEALRQAEQILETRPAVFVPALDGGYALVGLTRPAEALFLDMTWSTPRVMQDTRDRARGIGLVWAELPAVADIDEPDDLARLPEDWR